MKDAPTVFLVDDDDDLRALVERQLVAEGFLVEDFSSGEDCLSALHRSLPDVVVLDLNMPGLSGAETLRAIKAHHRYLPVIVLSGQNDVPTVVEAMREGAFNFVPKSEDSMQLIALVRNASEQHRMSVQIATLEGEAAQGQADIIGNAPPMRHLMRQIVRLAPTDVSVYIHGESGVGKELVSRAIHARSARADGPLVALNCAAIPESLQESELFGHERGAFTGAATQRVGRFEQADGGTLFLDEVAELSLALQAKLLRVLQEKHFCRVGSTIERNTDFRLLVATNCNLLAEVEAGRFRPDLYYRIVVYELHVPPLRERLDDLSCLVAHFCRAFAPDILGETPRVAADYVAALRRYNWPGNVRELQNVVQRSLISCRDGVLRAVDLPRQFRAETTFLVEPPAAGSVTPSAGAPSFATEDDLDHELNALLSAPDLESDPAASLESMPDGALHSADANRLSGLTLAEVERLAIEEAMERCEGNRSLVAQRLGIGRTTLYRKLKEYGFG